MLDHRLVTFLTLCDTMHYRLAAERLSLTQPAVTQHIQHLERELCCKLFVYDGKTLKKTPQAVVLEEYARSAAYNQQQLFLRLSEHKKPLLRLGATKTIGDYVLGSYISQLLKKDNLDLELIVDNTQRLMGLLDRNSLDFALVEGFFDKTAYAHRLFRLEPFVGICSADHSLAGRCVRTDELFDQRIILREQGSGTRAVLEQVLASRSLSIHSFPHRAVVSSFELIKSLVAENLGISFVYRSVAESDPSLGIFTLLDQPISREFNFVWLKNTHVSRLIDIFLSLET